MTGNFLRELDLLLLESIRENKPETFEEAINLLSKKHSLQRAFLIERMLDLEEREKIVFRKPKSLFCSSLFGYLFSSSAFWFWIVIGLTITSFIMVFLIPEADFLLLYFRVFLGSLLTCFLPGYTLLRILDSSKSIDTLLKIILSLGVSLALVSIVGLLLNFTPWGIMTLSVALSLAGLTVAFSCISLVQEFKVKTGNLIS